MTIRHRRCYFVVFRLLVFAYTYTQLGDLLTPPGLGPREALLLHWQDKLCGFLGAPRLCLAVPVLQMLTLSFWEWALSPCTVALVVHFNKAGLFSAW